MKPAWHLRPCAFPRSGLLLPHTCHWSRKNRRSCKVSSRVQRFPALKEEASDLSLMHHQNQGCWDVCCFALCAGSVGSWQPDTLLELVPQGLCCQYQPRQSSLCSQNVGLGAKPCLPHPQSLQLYPGLRFLNCSRQMSKG